MNSRPNQQIWVFDPHSSFGDFIAETKEYFASGHKITIEPTVNINTFHTSLSYALATHDLTLIVPFSPEKFDEQKNALLLIQKQKAHFFRLHRIVLAVAVK